jgi:hypothetical protein
VLKRLLAQPMVASVKSSILLEELKATNVLPSTHLEEILKKRVKVDP